MSTLPIIAVAVLVQLLVSTYDSANKASGTKEFWAYWTDDGDWTIKAESFRVIGTGAILYHQFSSTPNLYRLQKLNFCLNWLAALSEEKTWMVSKGWICLISWISFFRQMCTQYLSWRRYSVTKAKLFVWTVPPTWNHATAVTKDSCLWF